MLVKFMGSQGGRPMEPNFLFCWPHAQIGVVSSKDLLAHGSKVSMEELIKQESQYPSSALLHDGVILPSETRKVSKLLLLL